MGEERRIIRIGHKDRDGDEEWRAAMLFLAKGPSATLQFLQERPKALLYAYQAQALDGPCPIGQDGSLTLDPTLRAKQEAWKALGNMTKTQAKREFVQLLTDVLPEWKIWYTSHVPSLEAEEPADEVSKILRDFYKKVIVPRANL